MVDRENYKTFRPGDIVTPRRVVKSGRSCAVVRPGDEGRVIYMKQYVMVRFSPYLWSVYDGDLRLVRR
jgi:hypothetical protein